MILPSLYLTVKSYPSETYELMARCLAGEASPEEAIHMDELLAGDEELKIDYETLKLLMFDKCDDVQDGGLKSKFKQISRRLEDGGLM